MQGYIALGPCRALFLEEKKTYLTVPASEYQIDPLRDDTYFELNKKVVSASGKGRLEIVKLLVSLGADIKSDDSSAAESAIENGHIEIVKYLVSLGKNIDTYYIIRWAKGIKMVKYLVSLKKIDADIKHEDPKIVKYLVSLGVNTIESIDAAFRWAIANGHLLASKYLISLGANIRPKNTNLVETASYYGHLGVVKFLVSLGTYVTKTSIIDSEDMQPEIFNFLNKKERTTAGLKFLRCLYILGTLKNN